MWGVGRKTEPMALWVSTDSGAAPRGRVRPAARLHPLLGAGAAAGVGGVAAQRPDVSATCPGPFVLGSLTRLSFLCRRPPSPSSHFSLSRSSCSRMSLSYLFPYDTVTV